MSETRQQSVSLYLHRRALRLPVPGRWRAQRRVGSPVPRSTRAPSLRRMAAAVRRQRCVRRRWRRRRSER